MKVDGDYALEVKTSDRAFTCDAGVVRRGRKQVSGLARYRNDAGNKRNNAVFTAKMGTVHTWGIKVLPGKQISPGEEVYVAYGQWFWKKYAKNS